MVSMGRKKFTFEQAVWDKIELTGFCWLWRGYVDKHGYGYASWEGKSPRAHRIVFETLVGTIPQGLQLDHLCRIRNCVNPCHLEPVSCKENLSRSHNTQATVNTRKTHCAQGHEYTPENTSQEKSQRACKTCKKIRAKARNSTPEARAKHAAYERARKARLKAEQLG